MFQSPPGFRAGNRSVRGYCPLATAHPTCSTRGGGFARPGLLPRRGRGESQGLRANVVRGRPALPGGTSLRYNFLIGRSNYRPVKRLLYFRDRSKRLEGRKAARNPRSGSPSGSRDGIDRVRVGERRIVGTAVSSLAMTFPQPSLPFANLAAS